MTIQKIITEPNTLLRKISEPVEKIDNNLKSFMKDMIETMYEAPGIGLAAVQLGILRRVIVIDISKDENKNPLFIVNPKILNISKEKTIYEEGCLSLPGHFAEIERPAECTLEYLDFNGKKKK